MQEVHRARYVENSEEACIPSRSSPFSVFNILVTRRWPGSGPPRGPPLLWFHQLTGFFPFCASHQSSCSSVVSSARCPRLCCRRLLRVAVARSLVLLCSIPFRCSTTDLFTLGCVMCHFTSLLLSGMGGISHFSQHCRVRDSSRHASVGAKLGNIHKVAFTS